MNTFSSYPQFPNHLEDLLLQFDAQWNQPGIEQLRAVCPADAGPEYQLELIRIDAQKRLAAGQTLDEAFYLQAFPQLAQLPEQLQKLRAITFTPMPVGESVLRALAATTPVLPQVNLPAMAEQGTLAPLPASSSTVPEHRYKLEGEIARGGMGAVLRGRDEDLGREIAVKVMLQTHAGKTELLQRFIEEAQIAGQLQHPGITPVYELGRFPDQRPYFTMKLVRGQTLAKLLKDRPDAGTDRPRFLKIFEQICQTLAYAHTRMVIHRDLKPHNIMVGSFGEVQVMDWGLAKVLTAFEASEMAKTRPLEVPTASESSVQTRRSSGQSTDIPNTQAGSVLGTPAYMPPEQARGYIDHLDERADVFGLGAILCEILTGQPPYVGTSGIEIYQKAVAADLADAITRLQSCGADSELITLAQRCLAANREDRPRDASELTKELTAYLHSVEDRLKQAELTAVKATTKAEEESKRRRVTFRLAAGILLTLLAGLAGSLWQMRRAMYAEELAKVSEKQAIAERDEKEKARAQEEQQRKFAQAIADYVQNDLLAFTSAEGQERFGGSGQQILSNDVSLRDLLDRAAEKLTQRQDLDPLIEAELCWMIGANYRGVGEYKKSAEFLRKCVALREKLLPVDNKTLLSARNSLAVTLIHLRQYTESIAILEQVDRIQKQKWGNDHLIDFSTRKNLAGAYYQAGRHDDAIALYEQIRTLQKKLPASNREDWIGIVHDLAPMYFYKGKKAEAIAMTEELRDSLMKQKGINHTDSLSTLHNLGMMYLGTGQVAKAIAVFEQIKEPLRKKLGPEHPDMLSTLHNLALAYLDAKRHPEAVQLLEQVRAVYAKKPDATHPDKLSTLNNLGSAYLTLGKLPEAIAMYEQCRDGVLKELGPDHADTLTTIHNLANAYRQAGRLTDSIPLFEQAALGVQKKQFQHVNIGSIIPNTFTAYEQAKQFDKAEHWRRQWIAVVKQKLGESNPAYAGELMMLAQNLVQQKKWSGAEPILREALTLRQKSQPDAWTTFNTQSMLGGALLGQKKYTDAEPLLLKGYEGIKTREKSIPKGAESRLAEALDRLIQFYTETNKTDEVKKWQAEKDKLPKAKTK